METPVIASSTYASATSNMADLMAAQVDMIGRQNQLSAVGFPPFQATVVAPHNVAFIVPNNQGDQGMAALSARRLVQVFIADPDENVPLADCLLYSGDQKLTDLTDQELFFEIDIKTVLDAHNLKRTALVNKSVKERVENLEPVRIRDLKMTVVTIATF